MKINIEVGAFAVSGEVTATWPARLAGWMIFATLGIMAVHALAASDVPDAKPTVHVWGRP